MAALLLKNVLLGSGGPRHADVDLLIWGLGLKVLGLGLRAHAEGAVLSSFAGWSP